MTGPDLERTAEPAAERRLGRALAFFAMASAPLLLWKGWGRWADVLVDFGREAYVAWRLGAGDVLQRDIAWLNGPLSPYWNAGVYHAFEDGLSALLVANVVIAVGVAVELYLIALRVGGWLAAGACVAYFVPVFGVGHFIGYGIYNFVTPYSHEATHGLALALGALLALLGWRPADGLARPLLAGVLLGFAFLTKPEIFLAASAGVGTALLGSLIVEAPGTRAASRSVVVFAAGMALVPLIALAALGSVMSWGESLTGVAGGWPHIFGSRVADLPFYRTLRGVDDMCGHALLIARSFVAVVAVGVVAVALGRGSRGRTGPTLAASALTFVAVFLGLFWLAPSSAGIDEAIDQWMHGEVRFWTALNRQLTLTSLLASGVALVLVLAARDKAVRRLWVPRAAFAVFSTAMLGKVMFNVTAAHYGFVLAVSASALFLVMGLGWVPEALRARGIEPRPLEAAVLAATCLAAWHFSEISEVMIALKREPVAGVGETIRTDRLRGTGVNKALETIAARLPEGATVLVVPEGVMVNYLSRRRTPTRHLNFMPPEVIMYGEQAMLAELEASPPDAVLVIHKETREYGLPFFGRDYGLALMDWIEAEYPNVTRVFGHPPLQPGSIFGIDWRERADRAASEESGRAP